MTVCDDSVGGAEPAQAGYKSQGMGKEKGSNFPQERVSKCLPETVGSKKNVAMCILSQSARGPDKTLSGNFVMSTNHLGHIRIF